MYVSLKISMRKLQSLTLEIILILETRTYTKLEKNSLPIP